jgi:hypothetical protein
VEKPECRTFGPERTDITPVPETARNQENKQENNVCRREENKACRAENPENQISFVLDIEVEGYLI